MRDLAVHHMTARFRDREPLDVPDGLVGFGDGRADGLLDAHRGRSGQLDLFACFLDHPEAVYYTIRFRKLGLTHYGSSGKPDELYRMQGLDVGSLVQAVLEEIKKK